MALVVAIVAADPVRRLGLAALVTRAGHQVLESRERADVVLADDVAVCSDSPPVVALGAAEAGQAGLLPSEATAAQIDATAGRGWAMTPDAAVSVRGARREATLSDPGAVHAQPLAFIAALRMLLDSWTRSESAEGSG